MSNSLWLHVRLQIHNSRLLCPWNSPGKNTGVGCHLLLQGIFPTQGSPPLQADSTIWATREASKILNTQLKIPCATTKAWCSQINTYSLKKESFFQFLNSLLISYIYIYMCLRAFIWMWLNLGKPLQTLFHMRVVKSQGISSYAVQWIILNILQIDHICINQCIINASAPSGHNRRWAGTKKGKVFLSTIPKRRWPAIT